VQLTEFHVSAFEVLPKGGIERNKMTRGSFTPRSCSMGAALPVRFVRSLALHGPDLREPAGAQDRLICTYKNVSDI
jgi:hypothetical protein